VALLIVLLLVNGILLRTIHVRYAALSDKIEILTSTESPRIVIVGGSNTAFGIHSELLQRESGYNVVNMGLNGNLGMRFMLHTIEPSLQQGDIVLIIPEFDSIVGTHESIGPAYVQVLLTNPYLAQYIHSPQEVYYFLKLFPYTYTEAIKTMMSDYFEKGCIVCENEERIYYRSAFNSYGDIVSHENIHPIWEIGHLYLSVTEDDRNVQRFIDILNDFHERTLAKDITILLAYPPTPSAGDQRTVEMLTRLDTMLTSELQIEVIGKPEEAWYSRALFLDKPYHLHIEGRELNTQRILQQISPYLAGAGE
jgi:hypothetical protein